MRMAAANESFESSSVYEANLVTVLPEDVIEKLAELDLELSEGKEAKLFNNSAVLALTLKHLGLGPLDKNLVFK